MAHRWIAGTALDNVKDRRAILTGPEVTGAKRLKIFDHLKLFKGLSTYGMRV